MGGLLLLSATAGHRIASREVDKSDDETLSPGVKLMGQDDWELSTMIAWVETLDPDQCAVKREKITTLWQFLSQPWARPAFLELRKALRKGAICAVGMKGPRVSERDTWPLLQMANPDEPRKVELSRGDWHDADIPKNPRSPPGFDARLYVQMRDDECKHIVAPREEVLDAFPEPTRAVKKREQPASNSPNKAISGGVGRTNPADSYVVKAFRAEFPDGPPGGMQKQTQYDRIRKRIQKAGGNPPVDKTIRRHLKKWTSGQ